MFILLQILQLIPLSEIDHFFDLFSDLEFEIEEMGWDREELIRDMLINHFGLELLDDQQLHFLSEIMKKTESFKAGCETSKMRRGL